MLNKPSPTDWQLIDKALDEATSCVDILIKDGITKATNRLNAFKA